MTKELYRLYNKIYWKQQTNNKKNGEISLTIFFLLRKKNNSKVYKQKYGMCINLSSLDG